MSLRPSRLCFALAFGSFFLGLAATQGQVVERRPTPLWMEGAARYEISFEHREPLLMAILLVASDREIVVEVNGETVGGANDPAKASSHEITKRLRAGGNRVALLSKDGTPVRAAALLELNGDLATSRWIATGPGWTAPVGKPSLGGAVDADPAANPFDPAKVADAYSSWKLARPGEQSTATDPAGFTLPPGFRAELVRSAGADEDSWVAMAFDPQGRITIAKEKRGLLRLEPGGGTELIEDSLLECRGLLYAEGALYAHANNSKVLVRLRDMDGDGVFEEKTELLRTEGGVGHGRNHVRLGPGGHLWIVLGNNARLAEGISPNSPLRHFADDQVLPNPWDPAMFDGDVELPAGHILRMSLDGGLVELVAGGMRNPLDLAFNREGEPFTFDADMEWDIRTPWYMPNRVLHLVSGADFGWRRGTGRFPARYADTLPSVADIGLGSPTAVFFGYGGRMPERYTEAFFICDWAYGRILAVHLRPEGASYAAETEAFIAGRPLNVTDGCIGPDGALWFLTGGRGTQSGLYRVSYEGEVNPPTPAPAVNPLRDLRRQLEAHHRGVAADRTEEALALILPNLGHGDRFIRHAARVALETIPAEAWQDRLLEQADGWPVLLGALALTRTAGEEAAPAILDRLLQINWDLLDEERRLAVLRVLAVTLARLGDPDEAQRRKLLAWLEPHFPVASPVMNEDLCLLLVRLKSSVVLERSIALLRKAETPEELLFYPLHLRYLTSGWDVESRRTVFESLNRAGEFGGGGRNHTKTIQDLRTEYTASLSPEEAGQLAELIHLPQPTATAPVPAPTAAKVKAWTLEDLLPSLGQVDRGRSFEKGREATLATGCAACHRVSPDPAFPAGLLGPDLVQVAARFGRRDLLDHILNPSKVVEEKYQTVVVTRTDGTQVAGSLESEDDESVILKPSPLAPDTIGIGKSQIAKREVSALSQMPSGLLDSLKAEQILDLLAFLEAGGDPKHRCFQP